MSVDANDAAGLVERYFGAMRRGPAAEQELLDLLADDVVYVEPFSGLADPAIGIEAVRDRLRAGWATPLPDMELDVLSIETDARGATATWECRSPALPGPQRGRDRYEIAHGRIARLEVTLDPPPVADG